MVAARFICEIWDMMNLLTFIIQCNLVKILKKKLLESCSLQVACLTRNLQPVTIL